MNDRKKTSVVMSAGLAKLVKRKGLDLDIDFSEAVEVACREWVSARKAKGNSTVPQDHSAPANDVLQQLIYIHDREPDLGRALDLLIEAVSRDRSRYAPADNHDGPETPDGLHARLDEIERDADSDAASRRARHPHPRPVRGSRAK